ncbi:hypothetical protein os1_15030 [Comamonadaceae bacterium OS-1]|nr:hypothetical protein os1_15030 [Comamonadaceae bacterium OS-1]
MSRLRFSHRATRLALPLILATSLAACSSLQTLTARLPAPEVLAALPRIQLGQTPPAQGDYVVYLPAHQPIRATAEVRGNIFEKTDSKELQVTLKQDMYLYKHWISYDQRTWVRADEAVHGNFQIRLPSYEHPAAGEVLIELNSKS